MSKVMREGGRDHDADSIKIVVIPEGFYRGSRLFNVHSKLNKQSQSRRVPARQPGSFLPSDAKTNQKHHLKVKYTDDSCVGVRLVVTRLEHGRPKILRI